MDAQIQRALAHPKRTAILGYLMQKRGEEGADEAELVDSLDFMAAKVRYHLMVLGNADLISPADHRGASVVERYVPATSPGA